MMNFSYFICFVIFEQVVFYFLFFILGTGFCCVAQARVNLLDTTSNLPASASQCFFFNVKPLFVLRGLACVFDLSCLPLQL